MDAALLQLPAAIQLALASGYAAYLVAYRGIREHHKTIDTAFLTLVFSLAATGISLAIRSAPWPYVIGLTFLGTVAVGVFWRLFGIVFYAWFVRESDLSWADDTPSAWAGLMANSSDYVSQVAVLTDDGTWLRCDDTRPFKDLSFGPCRLGPNGDVALYLTHEQAPGKTAAEAKVLTTVRDADYGDRLTYIPAARIKRVTVRHKRLVVGGRGRWLRDLVSGFREWRLRAD
jgi:hypothetical protein